MREEAQEGTSCSITTEFVVRMLGLGICRDTAVGNALRPACSPGQKKRVTTGFASMPSDALGMTYPSLII